ncbi:unnamed protein product [Fraxinus pennsylvanica]|uniref:Uncharacterized protein n=1 Tax=Fraxinus pennsylvanica TaxID=56036 RepID=A0AAD2A0U7_9LAMI|nr:unnamed protein product [Fraxinus pennsylvanica]
MRPAYGIGSESEGEGEGEVEFSEEEEEGVNVKQIEFLKSPFLMNQESLNATYSLWGIKSLVPIVGLNFVVEPSLSLEGVEVAISTHFFGIENHRFMEATPSLACANKCVFC